MPRDLKNLLLSKYIIGKLSKISILEYFKNYPILKKTCL